MTKKLLSVILACSMLFAMSATAFAQEQTTTIKVQDVSVVVPYAEEDIEIVREENFQETRVTIIDKATGEVIRTVGELKSVQRTNYTKTMYEEYNHAGCIIRLVADFSMYSSGSFAEILDVKNTRWKSMSGGGWSLEEHHSGYTKMAPNKFEIYGDATIEVASTSTLGGSAGYQGLLGAGFNMTGSSTSTWYARKPVSGGFVYQI